MYKKRATEKSAKHIFGGVKGVLTVTPFIHVQNVQKEYINCTVTVWLWELPYARFTTSCLNQIFLKNFC